MAPILHFKICKCFAFLYTVPTQIKNSRNLSACISLAIKTNSYRYKTETFMNVRWLCIFLESNWATLNEIPRGFRSNLPHALPMCNWINVMTGLQPSAQEQRRKKTLFNMISNVICNLHSYLNTFFNTNNLLYLFMSGAVTGNRRT